MTTTINTLTAAYAGLDTIPADKADDLIEILERSSTDALLLIYRQRVKFCWPIAWRILRDRYIVTAEDTDCACGAVLSAHEKTTGAGDCFGCRAAVRKGGVA